MQYTEKFGNAYENVRCEKKSDVEIAEACTRGKFYSFNASGVLVYYIKQTGGAGSGW